MKSFAEAYGLLGTDAYKSVDALIGLVKELSSEVPGASASSTYILYSGPLAGIAESAKDIAIAINKAEAAITIGKTDVAKFLNLTEFQSQLRFRIRDEILAGAPVSSATPEQIAAMQNRFDLIMDGKVNGVRVNNASLWDFASKKYVEAAVGNFRIIAPTRLDELSVFVTTELPALLENKNVLLIDGLPREDLLVLKGRSGIDSVKRLIVSNSLTQTIYTGLSSTNFSEYLAATPESLSNFPKDSPRVKVMSDYLASLNDGERAYLRASQSLIHDLGKAGAPFSKGLLKVLGPAAGLLGLVLAANDAAAAEKAGNHDEAKQIMIRWAVDLSGSAVAQSAAGAIAIALHTSQASARLRA